MNANGLYLYGTTAPAKNPIKSPTFLANGVIEPSRPRILKIDHFCNLNIHVCIFHKSIHIYLLLAISETKSVTPD